jgi:ethanolamine utilization protein EutN
VILARVIGTVVASRKDEGLSGHRLLVLQPMAPDRTDNGKPLVAVDAVGCGPGEDVFYVRAREAPLAFLPREPPVDATVVGIVDQVHTEPGPW